MGKKILFSLVLVVVVVSAAWDEQAAYEKAKLMKEKVAPFRGGLIFFSKHPIPFFFFFFFFHCHKIHLFLQEKKRSLANPKDKTNVQKVRSVILSTPARFSHPPLPLFPLCPFLIFAISQWHLNKDFLNFTDPNEVGVDMGVQWAWSQGYKGEGVLINFIDDGVEISHPDLTGFSFLSFFSFFFLFFFFSFFLFFFFSFFLFFFFSFFLFFFFSFFSLSSPSFLHSPL